MITITDKIKKLIQDKRDGIEALIYRGSDATMEAGFEGIAEKILTLPPSNSISTIVDDTISLTKSVPVNSTRYCYLKSLGGMTYKCNNLIPFPYYANRGVGHTYTQSGVTFTIDEDRIVSINGTGTAIVEYTLFQGYLPAGTYTMSGINATNNTAYYMQMRDKDGNWYKNAATVDGANKGTFTITTEEANQYYCRLNIRVVSGVTFTNIKVRPMLNIGSTALPYEPYYEGLRDNKATAIKSYGAQLIPFPYYGEKGVGYTETLNGITFTVNEDRSITINGTSVGCSFLLANYLDLPSDNYTISVICIGGTWTGNYNNSPYISGTGLGGSNYPISTRPTATISTKPVWYSINVPNGAVVDNVTLKIMLNKGSIAVPYQDFHEPTTYLIPESLQGTGKGVEGAADTIDFETSKEITRVKTIALGDVTGYMIENRGSASSHPYISDAGLTSVISYSFKDFSIPLRTKALCNRLPNMTDWQGNTIGVNLQNMASGSHFIQVCIKASDAGATTDDAYATIVSKVVQWLKENNVTLTYAIAEPTTEDIDVSAFDTLIEVEPGGSIEFITDSGKAPNSIIIYQTLV